MVILHNGYQFEGFEHNGKITGKLTGTLPNGGIVNYQGTHNSYTDLFDDIEKKYPTIEKEVIDTFRDEVAN